MSLLSQFLRVAKLDHWAAPGHTTMRNGCALMHVSDLRGNYCVATVEQILAAARQAIELKVPSGTEMTSPQLVREYLLNRFAGLEHEVFGVMFLDAMNRLIDYQSMFEGTVNQTSVYPREVVKAALRCNAVSVILAHNHPSGNPQPSWADELLTKRLKDALDLVDIRVLDHLVAAGTTCYSFAENGLL